MAIKKKTILYIDGFNLYYGALKSTPYLWLNPTLLAAKVFSRCDIVSTKYYSAKVEPLPNDPNVHIRQQKYWEALRSLENFDIIEGYYSKKEVTMKNVHGGGFSRVWKTEEKKSDVNLACGLLLDAFQNNFDTAIVITGDSDLVTPISIVKSTMRKTVLVINPQLIKGDYARSRRNQSQLKNAASAYRGEVIERLLRNSQLPPTIELPTGSKIHKPSDWNKNYPPTAKR